LVPILSNPLALLIGSSLLSDIIMNGWMEKAILTELGGDDLDMMTKILIVVDSYDAMTSKRNHRENMSMAEAVQELQRCSGSQFDSSCVEAFGHAIVSFNATSDAFSREYLENFKIDTDD